MEGFTQAAVLRQNDTLTISWSGDQLGKVKVYQAWVADFTESEGNLLTETTDASFDWIIPDTEKRPYFLLSAENGARLRIAERVIKMDALVNFRDLGGYLTTDGRRTKWGKLLRSAAHDAISDRDVRYLKNIGLKTVVDYRSTDEEKVHPDREIEGVAYQHTRPLEDPGATNILNTKIKMETEADAIAALSGANRTLAKSKHANGVYRNLVKTALDTAQVPMVQHCTAGKDRVGVGSATLLLALGVPKETIIADYLLSNDNQVSVNKLQDALPSGAQLSDEKKRVFQALAQVRTEYLEAFFDEIDQLFGSVHGYLTTGLGLTDDELAKMKELYLEEM